MGKINFGSVKEQKTEFSLITEDRYALECVDASLGISKAGNKKIEAQLKIIENPEFENRLVFATFSLLPNALFNLKNYFDAAGLDTSGEVAHEDIPKNMIGTRTTAFIELYYYKNKDGEEKPDYRPTKWKPYDTTGNPVTGGGLFK